MNVGQEKQEIKKQFDCYHCGEKYVYSNVRFDNKDFCCEGCRLVYELLQDNNLCTYYTLNTAPGNTFPNSGHSEKFTYLDNENVSNRLIRFRNANITHVMFYIPKMHCSSCIWLLENLHRLSPGIYRSDVNFLRKEVTIIFNSDRLKLSQVAELLVHIGYEPLINLTDLEAKDKKKTRKKDIIRIGLAGFCFGNIMMLSFPEYFSSGNFFEQNGLSYLFAYLNLLLALPVFLYCASTFFISAWKSIRHAYLNIDAPIALAILITFLRSVYEILSHTGAGYLDSMSGIVFFMLIGRYFQNVTYDTLSFERDYKSYFPVGVTVKQKTGKQVTLPVSEIKKSDRIIIHHNELIPADAILISSRTHVDYSFITGESNPVVKLAGDLLYAGGKQIGGAIELEVVNVTSQSYLTQLWNKGESKQSPSKNTLTDRINKYFTLAVLSIAICTALYWLIVDSSKSLNAMTAVLIVACPCGLLLTSTFANGNTLRILGRNKFYLKNAAVIEKLSKSDTIIFDKTGTITNGSEVSFVGRVLSENELKMAVSLASHSSHPLSRKIHSAFGKNDFFPVNDFDELPGKGILGKINGGVVKLGSMDFIGKQNTLDQNSSSCVFFSVNNEVMGYFKFTNRYRTGLVDVIAELRKDHDIKLLSGDNDAERNMLTTIFGKQTDLIFNQKPDEKMEYVRQLRQKGQKVVMIGDGLNDAGALKESDVGIAVSDDTNNFSPACDAILDGSVFSKIPLFISLTKSVKKVILITFLSSLVYNLIGLAFAVQGTLSPVIAAILMPLSSISIVLMATISTSLLATAKGL